MAPNHGYWGQTTSTLDWCEKNYEVSFYIAEFWNTVSNLVMILPPLWAAYSAWKDKLEAHYLRCHLLLTLVGIGSWCFHMTLRYEMQLMDELPMIWDCCAILYCVDSVIKPPTYRNPVLFVFLIAYSITVTVAYIAIKTPLFHQVMYGVLASYTILRGFKLSRTKYCNGKLFYIGLCFYLFGFLLWNIDNVYCQQLTVLRSVLPFPLKPATQLHAWWHLFTGYTAYIYIIVCCQARMNYLNINYNVKFGLTGVWIAKNATHSSEYVGNGTASYGLEPGWKSI